MRLKLWRPLSLIVTIALLLMAVPGAVANAATASGPGNGLRVSPVRTDITIQPGTTQTVTVQVTNVTNAAATFQAIVNDFTAAADESGNPAVILNPNQYASSHSLKQFVGPISSFTLQPGQQAPVAVTITIPKNAPGGGYYGVVRFAPLSTAAQPGKNVTVAGSVGSLILVTVPGNLIEKVSIASFDVRRNNAPDSFFLTNKNLFAVVRFQNEGNVQEEPFGKILLKNHSGKVLGQYNVNDEVPPGNVLPNSIRLFSVPLTHVGSFGQFKLEGNFGYGSNGQLLSASTTIYVIPVWLIIVFVVAVIVLGLLVFVAPRVLRAYNNRVIRHAGRR